MALLTVHARQVDPTFQGADVAGDTFANDGATEVLIVNPGPTAITVIALAARKCSHGFLDNWIKSVPAGQMLRFGPFLPSQFNSPTGIASISYSNVTGISVAAQRQR